MSTPSRWFRFTWLALICAGWLLLGWLATHLSESADVLQRYSWSYFVFLALIFCFNVSFSLFLKERVYHHRHAILLLLLSTCVAFMTAEVYCRIGDPLGISYFEETRRYNQDRIADSDLIFRHRPSWEATYQGVAVRFNELGLRDDPVGPKKPSEYRILVLGDSITFGWGVVQDKVFSARLQHILSTELKQPVRVINAGVSGYNTVQEYIFLRKGGLALEPDLIVLLYHPNDIEPHPPTNDSVSDRSLRDKSPPRVIHLLLERSWLYRLAVYAGRYGRVGVRSAADLDTQDFRMENGWKSSMKALRNMTQLCAEQHIPMVVFYVRLLATPYTDALLKDVRDVLAPVPVEDMRSWFIAEDKWAYMNSRMDPHLNPIGHQVTAEHMADYLLNRVRPQSVLSFSRVP